MDTNRNDINIHSHLKRKSSDSSFSIDGEVMILMLDGDHEATISFKLCFHKLMSLLCFGGGGGTVTVARSSQYQNSFFPRSIAQWNSLLQNIVNSSFLTFKSHLILICIINIIIDLYSHYQVSYSH